MPYAIVIRNSPLVIKFRANKQVPNSPAQEQLFRSTLEGTQAKPNQINPYAGNYFTRIYDPRLDLDSAAAWYLAGPKGKTVTLFFLNGNQKPFLETREGFDVDAIEYKVRIDVAGKAVDYRALYKNAGE